MPLVGQAEVAQHLLDRAAHRSRARRRGYGHALRPARNLQLDLEMETFVEDGARQEDVPGPRGRAGRRLGDLVHDLLRQLRIGDLVACELDVGHGTLRRLPEGLEARSLPT